MAVTQTGGETQRADVPVDPPVWARLALPSVADLIWALTFLLFTVGPWASGLLWDTSTGWHIRNGERIVQNLSIPHTDPFSYTLAGQPWYAWEWLWDTLTGAMHLAFGLSGVVVLTAAVLGLTFAMLYRLTARRSGNVLLAVVFTMAAVMGASIHVLARPHVASWLLVLVTLHLLERLESGGRGAMWGLLLVFGFWANLHGGFVLGLALIAVHAAAAALERNLPLAKRLAAVLGFSALATLVNPYGLKLHVHVVRYLASRTQMDNIDEFLSPNFHLFGPRVFLGIVVAVLAVMFASRTVRWRELLLVVLAVSTALLAARNIPTAAMVLVYAAAPYAAELLRSSRFRRFAAAGERMFRVDSKLRAHLFPVGAAVILLVLMYFGGRLPNARWMPERVPDAAAKYLVQNMGVRDHAFAPDHWSGYLIYSFANQGFRVAVDDRTDFYGDTRFRQYLEVTRGGPEWRKVVDDWQIRYALAPIDSSLRSLLASAPDWREAYSDKTAAVFVRDLSVDSGTSPSVSESPAR